MVDERGADTLVDPLYPPPYNPRPPDAGWSSLVARRAHNPKVVGSNPAPATKEIEAPL